MLADHSSSPSLVPLQPDSRTAIAGGSSNAKFEQHPHPQDAVLSSQRACCTGHLLGGPWSVKLHSRLNSTKFLVSMGHGRWMNKCKPACAGRRRASAAGAGG